MINLNKLTQVTIADNIIVKKIYWTSVTEENKCSLHTMITTCGIRLK